MSLRFPEAKQYVFDEYLCAKAAMVRVWTPKGNRLPLCAVCGWPCVSPEGHHILITRTHALCDLRNIVPVCNQAVGDCHKRAHTKKGRAEAIQRLYYVIGQGNPQAGREIVLSASKEWTITKVEVPEVDEEINLWV